MSDALDMARNQEVAERLGEAADLLERQQANPFRVHAYRRAADVVAGLDRDVGDLFEQQGIPGLVALPAIGLGLARAIAEILRTGRWSQLDRLRGALDPVALFRRVPGLGPELARRIHEVLRVDTLEALEVAAHDGRLAAVPGVGPRRVAAIRATLAGMLAARGAPRRGPMPEPDVATLLDVDREYREQADAGRLPTIAPRRFNPGSRAWLPILHTRRGTWHFTALFSNTPRAHELRRERDWVVVYFYDDAQHEGQRTVVTETRGPLDGRRVVRGREAACVELYPAAAAGERQAAIGA